MAFHFQSVFPTNTTHGFIPGVVTLQHGYYEYDWPGNRSWHAGAGAQFRRDIVNWFRGLPPNTYDLLLTVEYTDEYDDTGRRFATVEAGRRTVHAPVQKAFATSTSSVEVEVRN